MGRRQPKKLSRKLLTIRQRLGVSQTEMAKLLKLEISYTAVSAYELGTREPDLLTLLQYARVAGISTDVLIDDKMKLRWGINSMPNDEQLEIDALKTIQNYPAAELAYDIAINSYEIVLNRLKFVEERLQTTMALAAALTLAVPAIAKAQEVPLRSDLLVVVLVLFVLGIGFGTYARWTGEVKLLNPTHLYNEWLRCGEWVFKVDMVRYAGEHFNINISLIKKKWRLGILASLIFFLEFLILFVWASGLLWHLSRDLCGEYLAVGLEPMSGFPVAAALEFVGVLVGILYRS
jgi:transcriptional regulator with XRE-family HTH domain